MLGRLSLSALMAVWVLVSFLTPASAELPEAFPSKPITLIVPFQAGVTADLLFRGIAESASKHLGQPVVIDNKPGGSATLGPGHYGRQRQSPTATPSRRLSSPCSASPTCRRRPSILSRTSPTSYTSAATRLGVMVKADGPFKKWQDVIDVRQGQSGQVHLCHDRPGHHQRHRHGADGAANRAFSSPISRPRAAVN